MHKNKVFVKTIKGEREGASLADNLKRTLSLINGYSVSGELAKRAPPSLRKSWDDLIGELLKDGYIVEIPIDTSTRKVAPSELNPLWKGQVIAQAAPPPPAVSAKAEAEIRDEAEAKLKAEKAAKLKEFFAVAKEKAKAE